MATYTINILNQSGFTKSYVVFMEPSVVTSPSGETPVHANAWATFENVTNGSYDSVVYTPPGITADNDAVPGLASAGETQTQTQTPSPAATFYAQAEASFYVSNSDYTPGQVIDPSQAHNTAWIDFTGRPDTATVTQGADGAYTVQYN
jgi:hypothetical protein